MRIPILTYHAANIAGGAYADNDHVALATDLRLIDAAGWRIVPLDDVVDLLEGRAEPTDRPSLALTFDDGTDFDVHELEYPGFGTQPGFLPILEAFRSEASDRQPGLHATCFVIASPAARATMDVQCLFAGKVMNEDWWQVAAMSGLLGIGNHSWDHNHEVAPEEPPDGLPRGRFWAVDNAVRAQWQIDRAQSYIEARIAPRRVRHFAYPYGDANEFLRSEYLPDHGRALGLRAAYTTEGRPATHHDSLWALPRFVCGDHWRSPSALRTLLDEARA